MLLSEVFPGDKTRPSWTDKQGADTHHNIAIKKGNRAIEEMFYLLSALMQNCCCIQSGVRSYQVSGGTIINCISEKSSTVDEYQKYSYSYFNFFSRLSPVPMCTLHHFSSSAGTWHDCLAPGLWPWARRETWGMKLERWQLTARHHLQMVPASTASCLASYQSLGSWPIVMNGRYSVSMQISNMLCSKSNSFSLIDWINQAASNCTLQSKVLCKQD